jgi:hypothetical protein
MRFARRVVAASLLAASVAAGAAAYPTDETLDPLAALVQARYEFIPASSPPEQKRERGLLGKALAAYASRSSSLDSDLRIFQRMAKALDAAYAGEANEITSAALAAHAVFVAEIVAESDAVEARAQTVIAAAPAARVARALADADASLVLADSATRPGPKATLLRTALRHVRDASRRVERATAPRGSRARAGRGYVAGIVDDEPVVPRLGAGTVVLVGGQPEEVMLTGYGGRAAIEISIGGGGFTGPGDYALDGTSGAMLVLVQDGETYVSDAGVLTVTEFDLGAQRIAGTFEGEVESIRAGRRSIERGVFIVRFETTGN